MIQEKVDCYYCGQRFNVGDPAADSHWRDCAEHPARAVLDLAAVVKEYIDDIELAAVLVANPFDQPIETLERCIGRLRALARKIEELKGVNNDSV